MVAVTLDEAKAHLRVDGADEDADITMKLAAAEDDVARYLDRSLPWTDADGVEVPVPAAVKAAVLLVLGDLHANREVSVIDATYAENPTLKRLLGSYRRITFA